MIKETGELKEKHCPNPTCKMFGRKVTIEVAAFCAVCGASLVNSMKEYFDKTFGKTS